jgi:formate dehydrogenase gamma subunit
MPKGAGFISPWLEGTHGTKLKNGNALAASCADCHGSHTVNRASDLQSPVSRLNTPTTCGRCHVDIANQYKQSVHGTLAFSGRTDTPVCQDCHAEHPNVAKAKHATGPAYAASPALSCAGCHPPAKVVIKVAVNPAFFTAANPGYHGFSAQKDSLFVTRCSSCHGAHDIRPKSDSASAVNPANIPGNCGACHPEAATRFAGVKIHTAADLRHSVAPPPSWLKPLYLFLIIVFVGWRFLINLIDGIRRSIRRRADEKSYGTGTYLRMTFFERLEHWLVLLSFLVLVKTGLAIHFPQSFLVIKITELLPFWPSLLAPAHHIASGFLVLAVLLHLINIVFTTRGRGFLKDMLPKGRDIADAFHHWKYCFGLAKEPPLYGRFSYFEKSTYWFIAGGVVILIASGVIMAFFAQSHKHLYEVAKTVHYYQTMLSTLSLLVGHMYFVVFNPDIYPVNRSLVSGTLTEEEMTHLHPLELEERS